MARFDRSSKRRNSGEKLPKKTSRPKRRFSKERFSQDSSYGRGNNSGFTEVICASCGKKTDVPFKPTSNKPVYCRDCFGNKDRVRSSSPHNNDSKAIHEKLDKIMKALKIQ
ncbi:TPA: hypothetical protein HA278_02505 [Candidatus Woesearchaeota archaeon]|jgi:CxxC-x17-CxxC domain-containing protein|nr:hypothetical protein [archaeon]HIJ10906.1 hypothetical protein [Candidatus Woesearchaeota archaeon]